MSQLRMDPVTGDLVRENGTFVRIGPPEEIRQHVNVRLSIFRGECFLAATRGMRFIGLIFEKGTSPQIIENECAETILGTPGISSLVEIDVAGPTSSRTATVTWSALTSIDDYSRRAPIHDTVAIQAGRSKNGV